MRKRTLSNIVLLAAAISLAIFIAITSEKEERLVLEPLGNENPRSVSRIRLELGGGEIIELRRTDSAWQLVDPIHITANDFRVNALLRVLEAPVHARIDTGEQQLAPFGLAPARARVLLDGEEILFGSTEPIHGRRYLLYNGKIALVDDTYFSHLSSSAANYVHPALLGRDPSLQSILLPDARIFQQADNWRLDSNDDSASDDDITRLVDAWRHAQATAVRPYEQSLDWTDEISIGLADGNVRFDLARTEYELIFGRADLGIQYHMTKGASAHLLNIKPPDEES